MLMNGFINLFEEQEQKDSVSKYFRLAVTLRDSIYSAEKNRTVQALNFQEDLLGRKRTGNKYGQKKTLIIG